MVQKLVGFVMITMFWAIGWFSSSYMGIPLPASVIGLMAFAIGLFSGLVKIEWVEEAANFLLRHMVLFFVPTVVGVMVHYETLRGSYLVVGTALVVPLLGVITASAYVSRALGITDDAKGDQPCPR